MRSLLYIAYNQRASACGFLNIFSSCILGDTNLFIARLVFVDVCYFMNFVLRRLNFFLHATLQKWYVSPSYVILYFAVFSSRTMPQTGSLNIFSGLNLREDCVFRLLWLMV